MNIEIDKIINNKLDNSLKKLKKNDEFEVMFKNYKHDQKINLAEFIHVVKILTNYCKDHKLNIKNENSLDLNYAYDINSFDNYRLSINKQETIENVLTKYKNRKNHVLFSALVNEKLDGNKNILLIQKKRNNKLTFDYNEFNIRFRVSDEINVSDKDAKKLLDLSYNERFNIKIRLKERASFTLFKNNKFSIRADCTISKISQSLNNLNNVNEVYEIELELVRNNSSITNSNVKDILMEKVGFIIKNLNKTDSIIKNSEKEKTIQEYFNLVSNKKKLNNLYRMNPESLEIQHVIDKITNSYSVTDKADGYAYQALILNNKLYFIDINLKIIDSGIENKMLSKFNKTIIDGELIYIPSKKKSVFLCFDIIYYNGKDLRDEPSLKNRINYLDDVLNNIFSKINYLEINDYYNNVDESLSDYKKKMNKYLETLNSSLDKSKENIIVMRKFFLFTYGFSDNEIFKYSTLMWNMYKTSLCPYMIDGLMYTSMNQKYTKIHEEVAHKIYKWKPPELNSIDFYIEFEKNKETGKIETVFDNTLDEAFKNKPYYIANLHVGKRVGTYETPVLFKKMEELHLCHIYLQDGFPRDEEGHVIQDNTVVEFYYKNDKNIHPNHRWIPIRSRYKKTESVRKYKRKYGNNNQIANRIWRSIINEFNYNDMIKLGDNGNFELYRTTLKNKIDVKLISIERNQNIYYKKQNEIGKPMRSFHNWIKTNLIYPYCFKRNIRNEEKKLDVFDIGMGRGGDILKFYTSRVNSYVGIDSNYHGIYSSSTDGALSRLKNFKRKFPSFPKMTFIVADAGVPFTTNDQVKALGKVSNENIKSLDRYFGNDKNKYDIVTCMFALHYFFENKTKWTNFTNNLNQIMKEGSYFLCTLFDGDIVNSKFNKKGIIESYFFDKGKQKQFFEVKKKYKSDKIDKFGLTIDVFISSFMNPNTYETEYIVKKDFLISELKNKCGLEVVETELFENIYNLHKLFFNKITNIESDKETKSYFTNVKEIYDMTDNINKASFEMSRLNRYYIFYKPVTSLQKAGKSKSKKKIKKINLSE